MQKLLLAFKKNFKMSKPQLKPSREGEAGSKLAGARQCAQKWATICGNSAHADCRQLLTPACLPAWLPPRLACSTRLELATCACLHCRVYCTTIYKPLHRPGQARRRPYGQLMHAMLPECAATPPSLPLPLPLLSDFPIDFSACSVGMWSPDWHETSANPPPVKGFSVFILGHYQ